MTRMATPGLASREPEGAQKPPGSLLMCLFVFTVMPRHGGIRVSTNLGAFNPPDKPVAGNQAWRLHRQAAQTVHGGTRHPLEEEGGRARGPPRSLR